MVCCEQEKLAIKEKKEADEAKFKYAQVDGRTEQVYIYSVSPQCTVLRTWHKPGCMYPHTWPHLAIMLYPSA